MAGCASPHGLLQVVDAILEVLGFRGAHVSLPLPYAIQTRDTKWNTGTLGECCGLLGSSHWTLLLGLSRLTADLSLPKACFRFLLFNRQMCFRALLSYCFCIKINLFWESLQVGVVIYSVVGQQALSWKERVLRVTSLCTAGGDSIFSPPHPVPGRVLRALLTSMSEHRAAFLVGRALIS